jgi:hypothetical protein
MRGQRGTFRLGIVDRGFILVFLVLGGLALFFWGNEWFIKFATHRAGGVVEELEAAKASLRFSRPLAFQKDFSAMPDEDRFKVLASRLGTNSEEWFLARHFLFRKRLIVNDFFKESEIPIGPQ